MNTPQVKEGLEILEEEGLSGHFFSLSWFAYQYASLHGQWEEAKYWAGQAYEHSKLINGEEHSSTIICKHGVHTPQCHLTRGRPWGSSVVSECIVA